MPAWWGWGQRDRATARRPKSVGDEPPREDTTIAGAEDPPSAVAVIEDGTTVRVYCDGSCVQPAVLPPAGNLKLHRGPGGWAALLIDGAETRLLAGAVPLATSYDMEIRAALEGLRAVPRDRRVVVFSDHVVIVSMMRNWSSLTDSRRERLHALADLAYESVVRGALWMFRRGPSNKRKACAAPITPPEIVHRVAYEEAQAESARLAGRGTPS